MTQAEKLEALVRKATKGGWDDVLLDSWEYNPWNHELNEETYEQYDPRPIYSFLFNHDFARALFGAKMVRHLEVDEDGNTWQFSTLAYQYHPMQAVIADDPIEYLYRAVFG